MNEVITRLVPLPAGVRGFVKEDPDGDYNIYIREQDPIEIQMETYEHEIRHILLGHLQREEWAPDIEEEAEHGQQGKENKIGELARPGVRLHRRHREEAYQELYGSDEGCC